MIGDDLLTLKEACRIYFGGQITPATLKAEHLRGNLRMKKIGRAYWVRISDLRDMEEKCLVDTPGLDSGSTKRAAHGQSLTDDGSAARDAALMNLTELRKRLKPTSRVSIRSRMAPTH